MVIYEVDFHRVEFVVTGVGAENAKSTSSPAVNDGEGDGQLTDAQATEFGSLAARANYFARRRPGAQFRCNGISFAMASPCQRRWDMLTRLAKYLRGWPRLVHRCWQAKGERVVMAYADASWVGDRRARPSTSGGTVLFGNHWAESHGKTQSLIALPLPNQICMHP